MEEISFRLVSFAPEIVMQAVLLAQGLKRFGVHLWLSPYHGPLSYPRLGGRSAWRW